MTVYLQVAIWCVIVMTGIVIYFPIIFIRKADKMLKKLEEIAANTHKAEA